MHETCSPRITFMVCVVGKKFLLQMLYSIVHDIFYYFYFLTSDFYKRFRRYFHYFKGTILFDSSNEHVQLVVPCMERFKLKLKNY